MDHPDIQKLIESLETDLPDNESSVEEARAEDIAQAISSLDGNTRLMILSLLDDERAAEVVATTDEHTQESLARSLGVDRLVRLLNEMDPDDAADLLALAPKKSQPAVLEGLEDDLSRSVSVLGQYRPDTAGGIMTTDVVAVPSDALARDGLDHVGQVEQPEVIGTVFVTDAAGTLVGSVSLRDLLRARPKSVMADLMETDVIAVSAEEDQEEAARLVDHYGLTSIPVVDAAGRLRGLITADDVIDVLEEEASEDMMRLAGTGVTHPVVESLSTRLLARAPWLTVTLAGTFFAGILLEFVEKTWFSLDAVLVTAGVPMATTFKMLMFYIPMIGGMAGNVGTQSSTIMIRGFATGEVDPRHPARMLWGEMALALMIGVLAGLVVGGLVTVTHPSHPNLGIIVGAALPCAILCAALAGTLIPFACHAAKVDPAYAGGPFLLTVNDLAAYIIYFWVAIQLTGLLGPPTVS